MSQRPLQVMHIVSADLWAGAEVATYHLLRALVERPGLEVSAVLLNSGSLEERLRDAGVPVTVLSEQQHSTWSLVRAIRAHCKARSDVVHAHRYKENLMAALTGKPWVATLHGRPEPGIGKSLRSRLHAPIDRFVLRSAHKVIAVSSEVARHLESFVRPDRIETVWNGITDPLGRLKVVPWSARPYRVGCLGRLFPVKAYELAIRAVARCPTLTLEIVGEGPERAALEREIERSGAGARIHLVGHDPDPLRRLGSWRALLMPSLHEGCPMSVIEALALGTPVFHGPLPGVAEMLAGSGGWSVESRDPEAWAKALSAKLDDSYEGEAASSAARRRFESTFGAANAAERLERVYRSVARTSQSLEAGGIPG